MSKNSENLLSFILKTYEHRILRYPFFYEERINYIKKNFLMFMLSIIIFYKRSLHSRAIGL